MKPELIYGCLLAFIPAWCAGEEQPNLYEYNGALKVEIPYTTILLGESMHARLRIENRGQEPIIVVQDGLNDMVQLVWEQWENGKPKERPGRVAGIGSYKKSPSETFRDHNLTIYDTQEIDPGENYIADNVNVASLGWSVPRKGGDYEFRPVLYGGGGKVLYGDPLGVTVVSKRARTFEKVFETTFTAGGTARIPLTIHEVPLEGETYLFSDTGMRFCRVPAGVNYAISFSQAEKTEYILTVDFDDPSLKPMVYSWRKYELVSASPETVPWLFDKVGEKEEKEEGAVRREQSGSNDVPPTPRKEDSPEAEPFEKTDSPAAGGVAWWPWCVGVAVIALLGWVVFRKRKA